MAAAGLRPGTGFLIQDDGCYSTLLEVHYGDASVVNINTSKDLP